MDAYNIGRGERRYSGDVKVVCPLSSSGEHGRKGAFVAFGNTESFYRNMVMGHGPYCAEPWLSGCQVLSGDLSGCRALSGTVRCLCQTSCQVLSVLSGAVGCV